MTDRLQDYRRYYARLLVQKIGLSGNDRLRDAFQTVPREVFLGNGPWMIPDLQGGYVESPTDSAEFVYQDILIALNTDKGIHNGQPSLHANNIANLDIKDGESIVHIGAGTGYYTAVLAALTGPTGSVTAYEYEPALASSGQLYLQPWTQASLIQGSAFDALLPPADVIYVNAGTPQVETAWIHQLNDHGRLLFPLTCSNGYGVMLMILRRGQDYFATAVSRCRFIGCIGSDNEKASDKLAALFRSAMADRITRLYLSKPETGEKILLSGDGWYLCA